jgi:hypothetical protein
MGARLVGKYGACVQLAAQAATTSSVSWLGALGTKCRQLVQIGTARCFYFTAAPWAAFQVIGHHNM